MTDTATLSRRDLRPAGVTFTAEPHSYRRDSDGKELQGVTTMIQQCLYPGEYAAVDPATLAAKALWGTRRHREIQEMILFGDDPDTPAQHAFAQMMSQARLTPVASEYTVTDGDEFASNIDVVADDGGAPALIDIKTTATLSRDKVSWQLSLYAMFFEAVNPHLRVSRLFAAWIPKVGAPKLVEIPRRSDDELTELMTAWITGQPYAYTSKIDRSLIDRATELKQTIAALETELADVTASLIADMAAKGERTYRDQWVTISCRDAATSTRFDSTALKADDPELYARYARTVDTKPSLTIRLRQ